MLSATSRNTFSGFSFRQFYPNPELNFDKNTANKVSVLFVFDFSWKSVPLLCKQCDSMLKRKIRSYIHEHLSSTLN